MPDVPLTEVLLSGSAADLTDDHIRMFRDDPGLLDLIGDRETLGLRHLWHILWIAAVLVGVSKIISVKIGSEYDQFLIGIASDLVFEMGAALIGSVATVIFIEHQQKRQFRENMDFRAEVQRRMDALDT